MPNGAFLFAWLDSAASTVKVPAEAIGPKATTVLLVHGKAHVHSKRESLLWQNNGCFPFTWAGVFNTQIMQHPMVTKSVLAGVETHVATVSCVRTFALEHRICPASCSL